MTRAPLRTFVRRPEALAALAGALLVVVAVVALSTGSESRPAPARHAHVSHVTGFPRSPAGAVQAATSYLLVLGQAGIAGGAQARRTVAALAAGPLQAALAQSLPLVASAIQAHLRGRAEPGSLEGWPLAFRLDAFHSSHAVVSIWYLDTAASTALDLVSADYATTTYALGWIRGAWRIEGAHTAPGPTPPGTGARAAQVDGFARAVAELSHYCYAP